MLEFARETFRICSSLAAMAGPGSAPLSSGPTLPPGLRQEAVHLRSAEQGRSQDVSLAGAQSSALKKAMTDGAWTLVARTFKSQKEDRVSR